jgi:UDP-4-amino-4,6-dideoxy-N-acetyl-beta-L-altrosamine N-acetyltransferase
MNGMARRLIRFVPLLGEDRDTCMKLLAVRNEESVRRAMFTDHVISADEHLQWMQGLQSDRSRQIWVILDDVGEVIGQVSLNRLDRRQRTSDWAFFLSKAARGGLGFAVEYAFLNFVFDVLGLAKLNCEVVEGNDTVVKLHDKFDFKPEGFRRSQVVKDDRRVGVHLLGLTREDWTVARSRMADKNAAVLERFSIEVVPMRDDAVAPVGAMKAVGAGR